MAVISNDIINSIISAVLVGVTVWTFNIGERIAVAEERLQVVSQMAQANQESNTQIMQQINKYNNELVTLVARQDLRLSKLETIITYVVDIEAEKFKK